MSSLIVTDVVDDQCVGWPLRGVAAELHRDGYEQQRHEAVHESEHEGGDSQSEHAKYDEWVSFQRRVGDFTVADDAGEWLHCCGDDEADQRYRGCDARLVECPSEHGNRIVCSDLSGFVLQQYSSVSDPDSRDSETVDADVEQALGTASEPRCWIGVAAQCSGLLDCGFGG